MPSEHCASPRFEPAEGVPHAIRFSERTLPRRLRERDLLELSVVVSVFVAFIP